MRADLEHDLVVLAERQRAWIAPPPRAVAIDADGAAEGEQPCRGERPAPHREDAAEARGPAR